MFDTGIVYEDDVFGTPVPVGVTGPSGVERFLPVGAGAAVTGPTSAPVAALLEAVAAVLAQSPADLPGPQALADAAALLSVGERLRAAVLPRLADVETRQLHALDGAPSASSWVAQQQTSLDRGEVALARRLSSLPRLSAAVQDGTLSVVAAQRVGAALARLRRHVDRPDGLVDGVDGEAVVRAVVVDGAADVVCTALGGLDDDDPRLTELHARLQQIADAPSSQLARLEAAFVHVATCLEPQLLASALSRLTDALLPSAFEDRVRSAHDDRAFSLSRNSDGSGWHITAGDLDLETGELLHVVLTSEMAVDPDNPMDTEAYARAREDGWASSDDLPAHGGPRSLRQRRHDALRNALRRYLDSGVAGIRDKVAPHLSVVVPFAQLTGGAGALPAVSGAGTDIPASLLRQWSCGSALTRFVVGLGRKVVETSHTGRTLTSHERRVKHLETGGRCEVAGCSRPPGTPLVPHHANAWARTGRTSVEDTVLLCDQDHRHLHVGKKRLRLRDGRWLCEDGWTEQPAA